MNFFSVFFRLLVILFFVASNVGCNNGQKSVIRVEGSDTMVNVAQAWAERYHQKFPAIEIHVSGGGSGVGIASLINGVADLANSSREMKAKERQAIEANRGKKPLEFIVGSDALAVYVHKDNPLESISLEELAEIYGDNGTITTWSQLGVLLAACESGNIIRVSRQNNSGTYVYFRETVLGNQRELKLGSIDQSGSKDVVALVANTPCAIGYSGMGYATEKVKMLQIAPKKGAPGIAPTVDNAKSRAYPIARPLLIYTAGEPTGVIKDYLHWIMSEEGQQIVLDMGYIPVKS